MPKKLESSLPKIRSTQKFREETEKCANVADEKLSEYMRKAIEERNQKFQK